MACGPVAQPGCLGKQNLPRFRLSSQKERWPSEPVVGGSNAAEQALYISGCSAAEDPSGLANSNINLYALVTLF